MVEVLLQNFLPIIGHMMKIENSNFLSYYHKLWKFWEIISSMALFAKLHISVISDV